MVASDSVSRLGTVASKQEAKASVQLSPREAGLTVLLVDFDSDKLKNIKNFIPMVVMSDALSPSLNTIAMT